MLIVADSYAIIALAACEGLELLEKLFKRIIVPPAVSQECVRQDKPFADLLESYLRTRVVPFKKGVQSMQFPDFLGAGERKIMLLCHQENADLLLIDDNRARKIARFNQIEIIGSLGVLLLAKPEKLIESVSKYIDLLESSNLHFKKTLLENVKRQAGE